jgi:hypothetical protein
MEIFINGLREVETKSGKNAGRKSLFFSVAFKIGNSLIITTGWRLFDKKIHPQMAMYGGGRILNLSAVDSATAAMIYFKLKEKLVDEYSKYELSEDLNEATRLIIARKSDVQKMLPELINA